MPQQAKHLKVLPWDLGGEATTTQNNKHQTNLQQNPFKFGKVVTGEYFYNREEELLRIKQTLAGGNNITLYAPRRYGKSSLVKKALDELQKEGFITVYVDFMSIYSRETFIKNYAASIARNEPASLEKTVSKLAGLISGIVPSVSFDSAGMPTFSFSWVEGQSKEQTLNDVIDLPQKLSTEKKKWIIAFDEFQEVVKLNGDSFEKLLRSCIQHHNKVSYLFLGSKTHLLKDMFNNKNRAFYHSASMMGIGKIDQNKSQNWLISRFNSSKIIIRDEVAVQILETAENIPYYIQFIAHEIWQSAILNRQKEIMPQNVTEAIDNILLLKADYYWELINKQTAYRKKVLHTLSRVKSALFSDEIARKYDLGAASTTQKALDSFIEEGIIERNNKVYEFADPFFKKFIQNNI